MSTEDTTPESTPEPSSPDTTPDDAAPEPAAETPAEPAAEAEVAAESQAAEAPTVETGPESDGSWPGEEAAADEDTAVAPAPPGDGGERAAHRSQALRVGIAAAAAIALFGAGYAVGGAQDDDETAIPAGALFGQRPGDDVPSFRFHGTPPGWSEEDWQEQLDELQERLEQWHDRFDDESS